mmetsp:Transcript_48674/g.54442  ORF Transcript_48674/g.54442 Transcript_48674/m.54442 type:complete len:439 (+) Transcript_48674:195-1511(+)
MDSSPFELQAKADEWMDITPTVELQAKELDRLKEAFEKCSTQLDSSRLENDLLKDRERELENENLNLRELLEVSNRTLDNTQNELKTHEKSSKVLVSNLELHLSQIKEEAKNSNTSFFSLREESSNKRMEQEVVISRLNTETERLERELKLAKADGKNHRETAFKNAEDIRKTRDDERTLRHDLHAAQECIAVNEKRLTEAKTTTGTIATLAEDLKIQKQGLERSLAQAHRDGMAAKSDARINSEEVVVLREKMEELERFHSTRTNKLKSELNEQLQDLEGSLRSVEMLQIEVKDSERRIGGLSSECNELRNHLSLMEKGRHDLLEHKSELEESFEEIQHDLEIAQERLHEAEALLEKAVLERNTLRTHRDTYLQSSEREAALVLRLYEQRRAFESRLKDIHSILGLKFTTAVQSEVREISRNAIEQMPRSFRVPLLL